MSSEPQLPFFVYGTLRSAQSNYFLLEGCTLNQEAAFADGLSLISLGTYPMVLPLDEVPSPLKAVFAEPYRVYGEVMTLKPELYAAVVHDLDLLEEYYPDQADKSWYQRVIYEITLADHSKIEAWLYFGKIHLLKGWHEAIPNGDWSSYADQRGINRLFRKEQG